MPDRRKGIDRSQSVAAIAVGILVLTSVAVYLFTECRIQTLVTSFNTASKDPLLPKDAFERLTPRMEKQKEQYSSWAYTALAALIAISVVKKVLPSPWIRWAYITLGPAGVLLLQTIRAGVYFDQRLTYLSIRGTLNPPQLAGIQTLLGLQVSYLATGLVLLLIFVGSFVVAIVAGKLQLAPQKEEEE